MSKKNFVFKFQVNATLSKEEIWPDGDAPDNPTIEDVYNLLKSLHPYFDKKILLFTDTNEIEFRCSDAALDMVKNWNLHEGTWLEVHEEPTVHESVQPKRK